MELCRHIDGVNPWTGKPRNPIDLDRADRLEERDVQDITAGQAIAAAGVTECRRVGLAAQRHLGALLQEYQFLVLPTLRAVPPRVRLNNGGAVYLL